MADARFDLVIEEQSELRGLLREARKQLTPIAELLFKKAEVEHAHRLRVDNEVQTLRNSVHGLRTEHHLLRRHLHRLGEEVGDLAKTIFREPVASLVRPSCHTSFRAFA